jgi:hypothetical protein
VVGGKWSAAGTLPRSELGASRCHRTLSRRSWHYGPVRIQQTDLASVVVLVPQPFRDDRGLVIRTFDAEIFDEYIGAPGTSATCVQDSQSRSVQGVMRGMDGRTTLTFDTSTSRRGSCTGSN